MDLTPSCRVRSPEPGRTTGRLARCRTLTLVPVILAGLFTVAAGPAAPKAAAALPSSTGRALGWGLDADHQAAIPAAAQSGVVAVSAGYWHSLALKGDGTVVGWGNSAYGALPIPIILTVPAIANVTAVAASKYWHNLVVRADGSVVAWGDNRHFQATVPDELTGATAVAGGCFHSLALKSNGTVVSWGLNTDNQYVPADLTGVKAISAGCYWSMVLMNDGSIRAFGNNGRSQVSGAPTGTGFVAISAGLDFGLALKSDGTVVGWGYNVDGEATVPTGLSGVVAVSAGGHHSLALLGDGSVVSWGRNTDGQATVPGAPVVLSAKASVGGIAAGGFHSLAVKALYPMGSYVPTTPKRVLDTRETTQAIGQGGKLTAGKVRTFKVAGAPFAGGASGEVAVPSEAIAITGNLTVTRQTGGGVLALGPFMTEIGETTTLDVFYGENRAHNVTMGLRADGTLSIVLRASAGMTAEVIFDVTGYFMQGSGQTYHTVAPGRVLDSRPTLGGVTNIGLTGKFRHNTPRAFSVAGVKGVGWPDAQVPSNATAVTGNLTVTNATTDGFVTLGPTVPKSPSTSTVNTKKGVNTANGVTVALNAGTLQALWFSGNGYGTADVIFDVTGYYTDDSTGSLYQAIQPVRVLNSATGKGLTGAFATGVPRTLVLPACLTEWGSLNGISADLVVTGPSKGFAYAAPWIVMPAGSSSVNVDPGRTVSNGFEVAVDIDTLELVWVGTAGTAANLRLDVTGMWIPTV